MKLSLRSLRLSVNRSAYPKKASLLGLPNDIIVCRHFYNLTHHAVLWKRFLRNTDVALPPLPPTSRHCLRNLSSLEAERLLVRTLSLDYNFQFGTPRPLDIWNFNAYHQVKQMILLPGSQYMVASVCEMSGTNWSVVVFIMDGRHNVIPIAKMPTHTKAYNLHAKYLTVNGVTGITVAYVRRAWRHRDDANKGIDISDYSGDYSVDPPYPVKYECHALHVSLAALEAICDPRFVPGSPEFIAHAAAQPPPFHRLCLIRSSRELGTLTLDEIRGKAHLTVLRKPTTLMMKPLDGGPATIVNTHRILAFRHLPPQNQTLIVRAIDAPPSRSHRAVMSLELCNIPNNLSKETMDVTSQSADWCFLYEDTAQHAFITEFVTSNWFEDELASEKGIPAKDKYDPTIKPPPIHIFFKVTAPDEGLLRVTFYPNKVTELALPTPAASPTSSRPKPKAPEERVIYQYAFAHASPVRFVQAYEGTQYRIVPGTHHHLLYTVPRADRRDTPKVMEFYRYFDKELYADKPTPLVEGELRRPMRSLDLTRFQDFPEGCRAFYWDDTVGRLVYTVEGTTRIHVIDYARRPKEDFYGKRLPLAAEQDHNVDADSVALELEVRNLEMKELGDVFEGEEEE
ncbi:hypothetical protein NM688_g373 [Phlebia brevispora]|uniref:Uncharacterized protein n=1 Tax=Phlebia brevispora TaxID=194682 RepID=A0ACC1TEJ0_9APHY|nr:hypothetical protein NM688_g373 [Phlebia brevispora]